MWRGGEGDVVNVIVACASGGWNDSCTPRCMSGEASSIARGLRRDGRIGGALGHVAGILAAPLFGLSSLLRQARTFHPRGPVYHAVVRRHARAPNAVLGLAEALSGYAIVRFSGALWKRSESRIDVLGCAVRLRRDDGESAEAAGDDQDLLFATIRRPWTMPFAPFTTRVEDYLGNDYFAVSPFDTNAARRVYLRLHPMTSSRGDGRGLSRTERLAHDVEREPAALELEFSPKPFGPWAPLVTVTLERLASLDPEALRFRPSRSGRGVRPRGFIHAMRSAVYAMSQRARPTGTVLASPDRKSTAPRNAPVPRSTSS